MIQKYLLQGKVIRMFQCSCNSTDQSFLFLKDISIFNSEQANSFNSNWETGKHQVVCTQRNRFKLNIPQIVGKQATGAWYVTYCTQGCIMYLDYVITNVTYHVAINFSRTHSIVYLFIGKHLRGRIFCTEILLISLMLIFPVELWLVVLLFWKQYNWPIKLV